MAGSLADRLDSEIREFGPIPVSRYVDAALYDERDGFYSSQGRAGRRGDFLTAPEVGPLFGAVVALAVDQWWAELGSPESFDVIDWGAGPGTLARAVLAAEPEALTRGALTWHLVERSASQRELHPVHAAVRSVASVGKSSITGVVLANELLDNLPFDILEHRGGRWVAQLVGPRDADGRFSLVPGHHGPPNPGRALPDGRAAPEGATVPWQPMARAWLAGALGLVDQGRVVVFDYGASGAELMHRGDRWLRTHRGHDGSSDWLRDPGCCDITSDVAFDQLQADHPADSDRSQADWLRAHGIDDLVDRGRRIWEASAGVGDLVALTARSRIREADALLDPSGMGSFRVLEWT